MEEQKTSNSQGNSEKKSSNGGITIPDFKLYYGAIAIKAAGTDTNTVMIAMKQNKDLDMNLCRYAHLIFDKSDQNI
jgi:hypothetical protein